MISRTTGPDGAPVVTATGGVGYCETVGFGPRGLYTQRPKAHLRKAALAPGLRQGRLKLCPDPLPGELRAAIEPYAMASHDAEGVSERLSVAFLFLTQCRRWSYFGCLIVTFGHEHRSHLMGERGMLAERLRKAWSVRRGTTVIDDVMRFSDEGLVLGAGVVLAKSLARGRSISVDPSEPRLLALLTAAHLRIPTTASLAHLSKAAQRWSDGEAALAAMHLVMSKLDRLRQPDADAHRLFLADALLEAGFRPKDIMAAIETGDASFNLLRTYDPNQPRVAAGSGRTSGQWTSTGDNSSAASSDARHLGLPVIEVTPPTLVGAAVQPEASIYACQTAQTECVNEALRASRYDTSPVPRRIDVGHCMEAGFTCDALSWIVEDTPFMRYAGVIFPHGGVVIIVKGQLDRYYRPKPGGGNPLR